MKRILMLGSNGQLGTDIQKVFSKSEQITLKKADRNDLDMEKPEQIAAFLEENCDFDYLINCTSYHKTDECEDYPIKAFTVNSVAVAEIAKFCQSRNRIMIHISTDYVFNGKKKEPYTEDDCAVPLNVYGNSKLSGEHMIRSYLDKFFIFRVSSLYGQAGASGKGGNFVETMLRIAREGKPLRVVDDQIMSPTHTLDIAKAIEAFVAKGIEEYGIYHCSGEGESSWYEFATEIFKSVGVPAELSAVSSMEFKTKAKRPSFSVLNNAKINRIYPMPEWKDSLKEYLQIKGYVD